MTGSTPPIASVSVLLERATRLLRVTLLKCLPFAMIATLCLNAPNYYWRASGHTLEHGLPQDPRYWLLVLIADAVSLYIFSAMMLRQLTFSGGGAVEAIGELIAAARRLPVVLLAWLLLQLSLFAGVLLLLLPAIFLLVCYVVWLPVALFERRNPYAVLVRCVQLVRPHWWKFAATAVIALLAVMVCILVVGALLNIVAELFAGQGPAFEAIVDAGMVAIGGMFVVFLSALSLTLHSAASSSA
jgi:hypothetical protein